MTLLSALAATAFAASFTVDDLNDTYDASPGDGLCQDASGWCTVRAAIEESNALAGTDTISIPAGTYTLSAGGAVSCESLSITDTVNITGAGQGVTILEGDGCAMLLSIDSGMSGGTLTSMTLDGGGCANPGGWAGVVHNMGTSNFVDVEVTGGVGWAADDGYSSCGSTDGGGIRNDGTLTLTDSYVHGNWVGGDAYHYGWGAYGAGIYNTGSLSLIDSEIAQNVHSSYSFGYAVVYGGGVYQAGSYLYVDGTTFSANDGAHAGGGVYIDGGTNYFYDCTFDSNQIWDIGGSWGTYSNYGGAAMMIQGGLTFIDSCTFSNNFLYDLTGAGSYYSTPGGAVVVEGGTVEITTSTFAFNEADVGGALYADGGTVYLFSDTVAYNAATTSRDTSGIYVGTTGTLTMHNSLLAHNGSGRGAADCSGSVSSSGYNLVRIAQIGSTTTCSGLGATDLYGSYASPYPAGLVSFLSQPAGSPTEVLRLVRGSPAIDAGDPTGCTPFDQTGVRRPLDGDGDGRRICDIGAFERRRP